VVEVTFEYVAPIAALILISVSIWGAAKKFTSMDVTITRLTSDIEQLKSDLKEVKRDYRELYTAFVKLQQKMEDKFQK